MQNRNSARTICSLFAALGLALMTAGCVETDSGEGDENGSGDGGASNAEVDECKQACNQLKFFGCNNSGDHASCFAACEGAASSNIELFVACVETDVCDASCSTNLVSTSEPPAGGSCVDSCNEYVDAGCSEPVDCAAACATLDPATQGFLIYCVARRNGCGLPAECTGEVGEPDPIDGCYDACDSLAFFDCIDAATFGECRGLCEVADEFDRDDFAACVQADGICGDAGCYQVFSGG